MTRNYELVVVLDPEIKAEEQEKLITKIKKVISEPDGKILLAKEWGKKEFTYPIKKKGTGLFYLYEFSAESSKIASIKQTLQNEENILRYLLTESEGKIASSKPEKRSKKAK